MPLTVKEKDSGDLLAEGDEGEAVLRHEGNLYFTPESVRADRLKVTDRTYTCPYKGTCNWVDYVGPDGRVVPDVGWLYPETKPGHEAIRGRYGFYPGRNGGTVQEG